MNWRQQQQAFADALVDPQESVPGFITPTGGAPSTARFNVYRNNVMVSLTEAIMDNYRVVSQLVGEDFATAMAQVYVGETRPNSPVLLDYGESYGDFIEGFEPAASLPFLPDMARLEWAWSRAFHAADDAPLAIDALKGVPEEQLVDLRFELLPSVHLLRSDFPVVSIWQAHQGDDPAAQLATIKEQGEGALIARPRQEVEVRSLEPGFHGFVSSLQQGARLGPALDRGASHHGFDPSQAIGGLFASAIVKSIQL